jgi:sec-independent protein translocase protein TatA
MGGLRLPELLLIFAALLLLFGGSRLPQLGQSLGSAIRNFKRGFGGGDNEQEPEEKKPQAQQGTLASSTTASVDPAAQAKAPSHQG